MECSDGDACVYAHGREELSHHPAKYKTRPCNGRGCRGVELCCFAHDDGPRTWAASRYSLLHRNPQAALSQPGTASEAGFKLLQHIPSTPGVVLQVSRLSNRKARFCASYPNVSQCRRGDSCAFAHSREECIAPQLDEAECNKEPAALTDDFFIQKFKTLWCPIGTQHDWQTCPYAHNYQDARRIVSIGYGPRPCPYYSKKDNGATDYSKRCPLGLRCPYSHGAKEQLYHPQYFRSVTCRDLRGKECPRKELCAFFHSSADKRSQPVDDVNYDAPLPKKQIPETWASEYLNPPFFPEKGDPAVEELSQVQNAAPKFDPAQSMAFWFGQVQAMASMDLMNKGEWMETPRTLSTSGASHEDGKSSSSNEDDTSNQEGADMRTSMPGLSPWAQEFSPYSQTHGSYMPGFYPGVGFASSGHAAPWWGATMHGAY